MIVTPFARRVKELRTERGLTVRDLAASVEKSVSYIAKIEVQGEIPSPVLICAIARVLGADRMELLTLAKEVRISDVARDIDWEYSRALVDSSEVDQNDSSHDRSFKGDQKLASVVSLINMKGGVGKTTLAAQLAHAADTMNLRVLAVDLDPQSNLSQALMGPRKYVQHIESDKPTVVQIFNHYEATASGSGSPQLVDVNAIVLKKAGYWSNTTLDLIPSRLELSRTLKNSYAKERLLAKALAQVRKEYDLIIIDCAPTESVLTDAAYFASSHIVVPIKPEFMATVGLPLLARSLQEFRINNEDHDIQIAGLVFNHSSSYSSGPEGQRSIRDVTKEAKSHGWHIFSNQVRYSAAYAKSAREQAPLSQTSYARNDVVVGLRRLTNEILQRIGVAEVAA